MTKIETGLVVTLVLAIISGAVFIGQLDGRLKAIESDKDYASLKEDKREALQLIEHAKNESVSAIQAASSTFSSKLSSMETDVTLMKSTLDKVNGRELCYCVEARHNGDSCSKNGGWTAYKGDGLTPDKIKVFYCE